MILEVEGKTTITNNTVEVLYENGTVLTYYPDEVEKLIFTGLSIVAIKILKK